MAKYQIEPQYLELEITENVVITNVEIIQMINQLKIIGVNIVLDDFGTGFSSLHHIKKLPIYGIKIGKAFVDDIFIGPSDGCIIKSIIFLAETLGLHCAAIGIETIEQYNYLKDTSCDDLQGYYFSHPLPLKDLLRFVISTEGKILPGNNENHMTIEE